MRVSILLHKSWKVLPMKMSTAIAYSFMNMDNKRRTEEHQFVPRRYSNNSDKKYNNAGYDNSSESGTLSKSGRRRPRKRSSSGSRTKKDNSVKVEIVIQFFKVGEIDTLKEQFNADVIVKAKWREPTFDGQLSINESVDFGRLWNPKLYIENSLGDPKEQIRHTHDIMTYVYEICLCKQHNIELKTNNESVDFGRLWNPKLYIENSLGDPKEQIRHRLIFNEKGEAFIYEKRVAKGTFMENLELDDFPFDVQDLTITVASELPCSECELIEDKEEHHVVNRQSFVDEQEWHLYVHTECNKKELVIDQVDNSVKRSALSVKCRAARRPGYFVWNIFMITFLICSLAFATFSVKKDLPQNRLQLSFTLVLTAVAFKSVVNSSLPRISYLTYMDKYLLVSMVMLSAVCTWHAIVTRLVDRDPALADHVENIVLTILGVLYVLYNIGFVFIIYLFPCKKRRIMSQKDREYKKSLMKSPLYMLTRGKFKNLDLSGFTQQNSGCQIQTKTSSPSNRATGSPYSRPNNSNVVQVLNPDTETHKSESRGFPPLMTSYTHFMTSTTETKALSSSNTNLPLIHEEMRDMEISHVKGRKFSLPALPGHEPNRLISEMERKRLRKKHSICEAESHRASFEIHDSYT